MGLIHTWHIHREAILRAGGIMLGMASMVIVLSTPHNGDTEVGRLIGIALRNVLFGLGVAVAAAYVWQRFYWNERPRGLVITPGMAVVAGIVALILALALGGSELAPLRPGQG